ncbi:MAG TPA: DUF4019 domain-containing protein [Candidatus Acidoferrales bacterium]|jgi:hypothetical protein|nr:DUF4019 domain-containing protein [Candidatus Acidoferrales bacterium]
MSVTNTACGRLFVAIATCLVISAALALSSCGYGENKTIAESGVVSFHSQLNAGQIDAIYSGADDTFRKATTQPDFDAFMGAVHRKLGDVQQAQLTNYQTGYFTGQGAVVTLVYHTQFAAGAGTEQFIWRIQHKRPLLVGYRINSNALILK